MGIRSQIAAISAGLLGCFGIACQSSQGLPPPPPEPVESHDVFSGDRAWTHLEALSAIESRASGSEGAELARQYITTQLEELELEVEPIGFEIEFDSGDAPIPVVNLLTVIEGASTDEIVLVAPYDSGHYESFAFTGANEGASGAALLLELARVLRLDPLPYSVRLVFLDAEGRFGRGEPHEAEVRYVGSSALAQIFAERGWISRTRLLVMIDRVGDADLRIARDLGSHRIYREQFWEVADDLGYTEVFPSGAPYETVVGSHIPFANAGLRRVVAISDTSFGGDEPPGLYAGTEEDTLEHCSPESLAMIGKVTMRALDVIGARLAKIDRFAEMPVVEPDASAEPEAAEEGEAGAETSEDAGGEPADSAAGDLPEPQPSDEIPAEPTPEAADEMLLEPVPQPLDEVTDPAGIGSGSP